jgi:endonuclease/exonuclease/phosphatase (EEP) superfamily protein YafD
MAKVLSFLKSLVYVDLQRRRRILRYEAWFAIIAAHLALLAAWLFPGSFNTASPAAVIWTWAMMLIRILYFQIGLLLLLIGIVAALTRIYRMAAACLPIVLLTVVLPFLNFGNRTPAPPNAIPLRVISANLLMINHNTQPILDEIQQSNADIVFLQEYTDHWDAAFTRRFAATYPYRIVHPQEDSFGAAIYSRYPFVGPGIEDTSWGKWSVVQLGALVDVKGITVECRNVHLMTPRTFDYTLEHFNEMRDFLADLDTFKSRPMIIAGDFNFTGTTLQAHSIEAVGFHDAFVEAGVGRGTTWPVNSFFRYFPSLRLDHIFLSPQLHCRRLEEGLGYGSDHRPLVAEIALEAPPS